jgi:predicted DCC family thiol-disulfide oxidoreductase YuxK
MTGQTHPIAVMDGTCALCAFVARMVHRLDRSGDIRIAPIQGATGAALVRDHGFDPLDPDSWLFIEEDGTAPRDLDGLIRLGQLTGGIGLAVALVQSVPKICP